MLMWEVWRGCFAKVKQKHSCACDAQALLEDALEGKVAALGNLLAGGVLAVLVSWPSIWAELPLVEAPNFQSASRAAALAAWLEGKLAERPIAGGAEIAVHRAPPRSCGTTNAPGIGELRRISASSFP